MPIMDDVQHFGAPEYGLNALPSMENDNLKTFPSLPQFPPVSRTRWILVRIGICLAVLDLCVLPMTYYYSLTFASSLSQQNVFLVIVCLFCMMTFAHFTHRCVRLLLKNMSVRFGPLGWSWKWRLLEFSNANFALCASIFEIVLIIGTAPKQPIVRLCALTSSVICYYFGALLLITAYLTQNNYRLPFNMSSTPKGSVWRPALLAFIEDWGAIECRGEMAYRQAVLARYEASPRFRKMLLRISWMFGINFLVTAVVTTILILVISNEKVAFGIGWGLPYVWNAIYGIGIFFYVKRSLREERLTWGNSESLEALAPAYNSGFAN